MAQWTVQEFITLLQSNKLGDSDAGQLIGRSEGAIGAVRGGIDGWHRGMNHSMLNQAMVAYLESSQRPRYVCARCGGEV